MDGFLLSGDDIATLRGLVEQERRRIKNPPVDHLVLDEDPLTAPEVYVCLTPPGGIPGLVPDKNVGTGTGSGTHWRVGAKNTPGSALCPIYQVLITHGIPDLILVDGVYPPLVYNLSEDFIPGTTWILAVRDKFGSWFAVESGGSSSDSAGPFVAVTNVCLSESTLTVQYSLFDAQHVVLDTWCRTNPTDCCSAGTGTGTSLCCGFSSTSHRGLMPATVYATFHNVSGCPSINGYCVALHAADSSDGVNGYTGFVYGIDGTPYLFSMWCPGGTWYAGWGALAHVSPLVPATIASCGPPFVATFNSLGGPGYGICASATVNVTISATPCAGTGSGTHSGGTPCSPSPTILAYTNAQDQNGATFTLAKPSATVDDNLMIALQLCNVDSAPTAPSGWFTLWSRTVPGLISNSRLTLFYHFAFGDPASYTFSNPATATSQVIVLRTNAADLDGFAALQSGNSASATATGFTVIDACDLLLDIVAGITGAPTISAPSGMSLVVGVNGLQSLALFSQSWSAGATGSRSAALSGSGFWGATLGSLIL